MTEMEAPLLRLTGVELTLGGRWLLENIDLTLIGPNGAGKTTLLRVALGLQKPSAGQVKMRKGAKIGYMPQKLHLDPTFPLSVRRFLGLACRDDRETIVRLLDEVGAAKVLDAPMQTLSGGELQRVLLARALVRQPDLLVLDEPVQGVDVHGQTELYQLIAGIRRQRHCAVLMVSHDLHLVMAATDRVLCLNRHICCSGTPEAVTSDPAYTELFGAQAVNSLAVYLHDRTHQHDDCANCQRSKSHE